MKKPDNNKALYDLWAISGLSQPDALALMNIDQLRPIALSTWKSYMAGQGVARRRECPDEILAYARTVFKKAETASAVTKGGA